MTRRISITSVSNQRLKAVRRLQRPRVSEGCFLVEGYRQLRCALDAERNVREVYAAPALYLGGEDAALVARAERRGARVFELSGPAFASISGNVRADGILAVVEPWSTALGHQEPGPQPLVLVAESVERPGNLGAIVRAGAAAGVSLLLVCDARTGVFHPDSVRGAVGTLFRVSVAEATSDAAIAWLREREIPIVVATPDGRRRHWDADLRGPVAVVVGSERHGVSERWLRSADETVVIPMPGPVDSLNVAVATGVVLFEATRQRMVARRGAGDPYRGRHDPTDVSSSGESERHSPASSGSPDFSRTRSSAP